MARNLSSVETTTEFSIPDREIRAYPVDAATIELAPHQYLEPEVNRLKEWAIRANCELSTEVMLDSTIAPMPPGIAIAAMLVVSLVIWGGLAGTVALLF